MGMAEEAAAFERQKLEVLPALYEHCCTVYSGMYEKSKVDDLGRIVYEGHLTKLFVELRLSVPYYTTVTRELKRMGCVEQIRRGGGGSESQWELIQTPTDVLWRHVGGGAKKTAASARHHMLEQRINDLTKRVNILEEKEKEKTNA